MIFLIRLNDFYWKHDNAGLLCGQRQCNCSRWFNLTCVLSSSSSQLQVSLRLHSRINTGMTETLYKRAHSELVADTQSVQKWTVQDWCKDEFADTTCSCVYVTFERPAYANNAAVWKSNSLRMLESIICHDVMSLYLWRHRGEHFLLLHIATYPATTQTSQKTVWICSANVAVTLSWQNMY